MGGVELGRERKRKGEREHQIVCSKLCTVSSHPRLDLLLDELDEAPAVSLVFLGLFKERPVQSLKSQLPTSHGRVFVCAGFSKGRVLAYYSYRTVYAHCISL